MSVANLRDLQRIPGVGPSLAQDLAALGIRRVTDLRRRNPERLYERLCAMRGEHIDRCVLYVFRCAVYFASESRHDPERLKWWNWKDSKINPRPNKSTAGKRGTRALFHIEGTRPAMPERHRSPLSRVPAEP